MRLFTIIARRYELVNHVLTFGLDIAWRRRAAQKAARARAGRMLDVCTGTGETAAYLARTGNARIVALDLNPAMLAVARAKPACRDVAFVQGDAWRLPFPDRAFEVVSISFAARTLADGPERLRALFREFHRVIAPGGTFVMVDTSQPRNPVIRLLFHLYARAAIRPAGWLLAGSGGYAHLSRTMLRFPDAGTVAGILWESGFVSVAAEPMLFGAAAIHTARVPETDAIV